MNVNGDIWHHLYHEVHHKDTLHHCQTDEHREGLQFEGEHHHCTFAKYIKHQITDEVWKLDWHWVEVTELTMYSEVLDNDYYYAPCSYTGLSPPST